MKKLIFTTLAIAGASIFAAGSSIPSEGVSQPVVFTQPPAGVPTQAMVGGPLLGNGDVGIALAGPPEQQQYYIGKNDFWRRPDSSPENVGCLTLSIPSLKGATYRLEEDMALAEARGIFATDGATIRTRSWVDANENLLVIEIQNVAGPATEVSLIHGAGEAPPALRDNANRLNIGREQHGGGRWYFHGNIADVSVMPRALTAAEIQSAAAMEPDSTGKVFNGRTDFAEQAAPAVTSAVTVSAWIKIEGVNPEANCIVSKGDWDQAYSLSLSSGRLRWAIGGKFVQSQKALELHKWIHVAGVFDGRHMIEYADGKVLAKLENEPSVLMEGGIGISTAARKADATPESREVATASRLLGVAPRIDAQGNLAFTLAPGATVAIATAILSDLDAKDDKAAALKRVSVLRPADISQLSARHREWWSRFWARSFIEIPDKVLERHWYAALYALGSCSRAGKVAPGLWGNWITTDSPAWHGDYHLNYNFEAPFYITFSTNHADLALPYFQPILDVIPMGRATAARHGWKGIHLPVSIGPWGLCPEGADQDFGQRSDAVFAGMNFIWEYRYTQDIDFLRKTSYPYLIEVANFWEDYLKLENGRYVDENDSIHEGSGPDINPIMSLGLLHTFFKNMVEMSQALGVDAERRTKWQDILDRLSAYPVQEMNGKTVFRYSEKGMAWCPFNTLGIYPVYSDDAIDLNSDPKTLEIARNTIEAMHRWDDGNGFANWYTACARVGYDPKAILAHMRDQCDKHSMPNQIIYHGGGGIEECSGLLVLNEMLLQSSNGVLRLFPDWPRDEDARFGTLRAEGAFLVSAEIKGGQIGGVKIFSEKGRDCTMVNPWPGRKVALIAGGKRAGTVEGERFTFKTVAGAIMELNAL